MRAFQLCFVNSVLDIAYYVTESQRWTQPSEESEMNRNYIRRGNLAHILFILFSHTLKNILGDHVLLITSTYVWNFKLLTCGFKKTSVNWQHC